MINDAQSIRRLLADAQVIAVVGHSDKPYRTSYGIGQYLREAGYRVYPVNPTLKVIDGQPCFASLAEVPEPIDIVDVFRRSEYLDEVVTGAIAAGAKAVWAQLGVYDEAAGIKAESAGLQVVMDRCIMVDHRRLIRTNK